VWDEVPAYESTITALGASGAVDTVLPDRTFHVAVENSTVSKLDYYVTTAVTTRVHVTPTGQAVIDTTVTVTNSTPAGVSPSYQFGPDGINSFVAGQYVGQVELWAPRGALTPRSLPESGLDLSQIQVSVLPQQSQSVTFATVISHAVRHGRLQLRFVPQPRLLPAQQVITVSAQGWHLHGPTRIDTSLSGTTVYSWGLSRG
jgi:hypothetical protein